jgi:hypothetical protein
MSPAEIPVGSETTWSFTAVSCREEAEAAMEGKAI